MKTMMEYRSAPLPGSFRHADQESPDACQWLHADDRPNPADDAKRADGSHDIGMEDGLHEIGLAEYLAYEHPEQHAYYSDAPAPVEDQIPDVDDCSQRRECCGAPDEEF